MIFAASGLKSLLLVRLLILLIFNSQDIFTCKEVIQRHISMYLLKLYMNTGKLTAFLPGKAFLKNYLFLKPVSYFLLIQCLLSF